MANLLWITAALATESGSLIIYTLLVRKEGAAAFHYFFHALEVALFLLARATLRHEIIAHHHVTLSLLYLFLDGFCARFNHVCRIERHLVTFFPLLNLWMVIHLWEIGRSIAQVWLILFHSADEVSRMVTFKFSCRDDKASVQVVFCLHRFEMLQREWGFLWLDNCLGTRWCTHIWTWAAHKHAGSVFHTWRGETLRLRLGFYIHTCFL